MASEESTTYLIDLTNLAFVQSSLLQTLFLLYTLTLADTYIFLRCI